MRTKKKKESKSSLCYIQESSISRYWIDHYNGCFKFEFNDKLLDTTYDSERKQFVSFLSYKYIATMVIYSTICNTV